MARLPQPGGDANVWGQLLNEYLSVAHDPGGTIKTDAVPANAIQDSSISTAKLATSSVTDTKLSTSNIPVNGQVLGYDGSGLAWLNAGAGGDPAMGGDLSGVASNAQIVAGAVGVTELATNAVTTVKIADNNVTDAKIATGVSQSKITNLTTDLAAKANTSTTVSAGTGLTGGGDLSANRTISANFGTTAGTIAEGNDSRITGAEQTANKGIANGYASLDASVRVPPAQLGSGTADSTTYLRGDGAWATAPTAPVTSVAGKTGAVTLVAVDVGLGNVNNTSDADKPVSTAQQAALDAKADVSVTDALDTRVDALESPGIVNLVDGANIATDASAGKHFRVSLAGDRTLDAPTNATDGMRRIWEVTASSADRTLTLTTGTAGSFELTTGITSPIVITNGKTQFLGAVYNASRSRWTILASQATT